MQLGFDPITFCIALLALLLTYMECRRNSRVILEVLQTRCCFTQSLDKNDGRPFSNFMILMRNSGISLHSVHAVLSFREPNGASRINVPFQVRSSHASAAGEFARGMIVEFGLKSYSLRPFEASLLLSLRCPRIQGATVAIYSQEFFVKRFRIGGMRDRILTSWNRLAFLINGAFATHVKLGRPAQSILRTREIMRLQPALDTDVMNFINSSEVKSIAAHSCANAVN